MKKTIHGVILLVTLLASLVAHAALRVDINKSTNRIYVGESFDVAIAINGADATVREPAFTPSAPATIQAGGKQSRSRHVTSIVNGRRTSESFEGCVFTYRITPRAEGTFASGPITISNGSGDTTTHPGFAVSVIGPTQQDTVRIAIVPSATRVMIEEPFSLICTIDIQDMPAPYGDRYESIPGDAPPHITAPMFNPEHVIEALKQPDIQAILQPLVDQQNRPAFAINDFQTQDVFGGFFDRPSARYIRFRLPVERITHNGRAYRRYTITLPYTATREGDYTFGPLTFKGDVITAVKNNAPITTSIYAIAPAVTITAAPPPEAGRPATFIGALGRAMNATAAFDANVCKVGDPLSLTLDVTGPISQNTLVAPRLTDQTDLTRHFRIYDDSVATETLPNGKRFTWRVRPMTPGTIEFPSIALSYYNSASNAYVTVATAPIPIQVKATAQIITSDAPDTAETDDDATFPAPAGLTLLPIGTSTTPLIPHITLISALLIIPPVLWLLIRLIPFAWQRVHALITRHQRHAALRHACARLRHVLDADDATAIVRAYFAERLNRPDAARTPDDIRAILASHTVDDTLANDVIAALRDLDSIRSHVATSVDQSILTNACHTIRTHLPKIDKLLLFVILLFPVVVHSDDNAREFLWQQANTAACHATDPASFATAATLYTRLLNDGAINAPLLCNLGGVLVYADAPRAAARVFSRAERYTGAIPETIAGIRAAESRRTNNPRYELPWTRTLFFWHYRLPCGTRALIAASFWAALWLLAICRHIAPRTRNALAPLNAILLILGIAFAASTAVSMTQEYHDRITPIEIPTEETPAS